MASDNILVAVKSRPFIAREKNEKLRSQWHVQEKAIYQIDDDGHRLGEPYSFDHIFDEISTNEEVYTAVVETLVESCLKGFNSTIFAYGQTSSGKTHTMMGTDNTPGIIQLAVNDIFNQLQQNKHRRYLVSCSYFEIYNEKINDLLDKNGQDLKIREDFCGNTFVSAKAEVVTTSAQVFTLMKIGSKIRKIGCTNMNERSSRSHTIFRFTIESTDNDIENGPVQISQLNLVDLAGSERIAHTKAAGVRLKEGVNINKSLSALGNVIRQLSENEGFINYRDSKLTRLLQHALGGNAKSLIIATITLAAGEETKSTLEFAQRAKVIKNKPIINEIQTEQDKLKQYELVTAGYKERLKKEELRIQEMEREKEEREQEILKLKQHVKLIDMFTKGTKVKKSESCIPRRHTVGYYGLHHPLQTIPEASILQSTSQEIQFGNDVKHNANDEELFLKAAAQDTDDDLNKMVIEETLSNILDTTLEAGSNSTLTQVEETPPAYLRKRIQCLEESYSSLQEFTKLEANCREKDKSLVDQLKKEKENLLKDLIDLNAMIKEERHEKVVQKLKFEEELSSLNDELACQRKKSNEHAFALEQARAEKDLLKLSSGQELNDNIFLLEQQKVKYENQLQYMREEIDKLISETKSPEVLRQEIEKLKEDNCLLRTTIDSIHTNYKTEISELEKRLSKFEQREEEDTDILSDCKQTQTDDKLELEIEMIKKEREAIQIKNDEFERIIQELKENIENLESLNSKLVADVQLYEDKNLDFIETEEMNEKLKNSIKQKEEKLKEVLEKMESLEKHIEIIELNKNMLELDIERIKKEKEVMEIENSNLERNVQELQGTVSDLEGLNAKLVTDVQSYEDMNLDLIETEEMNEKMKKKIEQQDEQLKELLQKIGNMETYREVAENIKIKLESEIQDLKKEKEAAEVQIDDFRKDIQDLREKYETLEGVNAKLVGDIQLYEDKNLNFIETEETNIKLKDKIEQKDEQLKELLEKVENLERHKESAEDIKIKSESEIRELKEEKEAAQVEIDKFQRNIQEQRERIEALEGLNAKLVADIQLYEEKNSNLIETEETNEKLKNEIKQKDEQLKELLEKIENLERHREAAEDIKIKLESEIQELKEGEEATQVQISEFQRNIQEQRERIEALEGLNAKLVADIQLYEEKSSNLLETEETNEKLKDEIEQKDEQLKELLEKIENLERHREAAEDIKIKLESEIQELKEEREATQVQIGEFQGNIQELRERIETVEGLNAKLVTDVQTYEKLDIKGYERAIEEMRNKIEQKEAKLKELLEETERLACHVEAVESVKSKLELEIENIKKEKYTTQIQNENLGKSIQELKEENKSLEVLNAKLITDLQMYEEKKLYFTEIEQVSEKLKINIVQNEEEIKRLLAKIRSLENHIEAVTHIKDKLELDINEIRKDKETMQNQYKKIKKNLKQLEETNTDLDKINTKLCTDVESYRNQNQDLIEMNEKLQNEIVQKQDTLNGLRKKLDSLEKNVFDKNLAVEKLEEDNKRLRNELNLQREKINVLLEKTDSLESRVTEKDFAFIKTEECNRELKTEIKEKDEKIKLLLEKIESLENYISEKVDKSKSLSSSSASVSSLDLSPKAIRRRKRQSIHDQRRGIDTGEFERDESPDSKTAREIKDLKETIKKLQQQLDHLTSENNFLESEVQGFMGELADYTRYNTERDQEIDSLKKQIEEMKSVPQNCKECEKNKKSLEELQKQVEHLTTENIFKESEIQGFMTELDDCNKCNQEYAKEVKGLKEEIEKLKSQLVDCQNCESRKNEIKQLEDLHKKNMFKNVELQTKIYDLQNKYKAESSNQEDKFRCMKYRIAELERRLTNRPPPETTTIEVQCDLMNYQQLLEKYTLIKRLAQMRREEANVLRAKLGMAPDEPVT